MLKTVLLNVKGFVRNLINENTDLRTAGREHFHEIKQKIENVRNERNRLSGTHKLIQKQIVASEALMKNFKKAYQAWNKEGNKENEDKSYAAYINEERNLKSLQSQSTTLETGIDTLDIKIKDLESQTSQAKSQLDLAASVQQVGRAKSSVEDIYKNIKTGTLSGAIESAELLEATAEATAQERKNVNNADILSIIDAPITSREDLLKD